MVQKMSKRGVYSGNTLRASNSRFNRQYSRRSCLYRKSWMHTPMKDTILDAMNINQDDVVYSLNKKGRWEIPSILKDSILTGSYKNFKYNVKLIVSHNIAKRSRTIGYYASKGKTKKIESKKKTYFNGESVAATARVADENASMGQDQEVVQIEVVYPSPKTSSVVHNPKYIGHTIEKPENGRGRSTKSRRQRQKMNFGKYYEELNDAYYEDALDDFDDVEEELDDESSLYLYSSSTKEVSTTTELLEDIMIHAAMMNSLCEIRHNNRKHNSDNKYETKDNKIYELPKEIDEAEEEFTSENVSLEHGILSQRKMDPVYIKLPIEELNHNLLKERYGSKFRECPSFPRKFIIDVSDRIKQRMLTTKCWKQEYIGRWDLTSCVVFTYDAYDVNNTDAHNVYRVCLNMATNAENFRILTMFDYFEGGIEDVLGRAVAFVDMISTDGFIDREINPPKGEIMSTKFENLNRHQKIEKEATFLTRRSLYTDIFLTNTQDSSENIAHQFGFECICSEFCGICFDQLSDGGKQGTALTACGHWFCDECWIIHCRSRMATGALDITCPQFDCKETVDEAILLTFVNVFEVLNLKRRAVETTFQSSENTLWCPNPICGRGIKVDNPGKAKDVACLCGAQICFQCQQKSHWPVTCDMASLYWGKMKKLGDDNFLFSNAIRVVVRGKQCPKCKRFVEKLSGCYYMSCPCGANFCWGCLGLYPNHINTDKCNQYKNGDTKGTETKVVREKEAYTQVTKASRSGLYKKALEHRDARHPIEIGKLKTGVRKINFKCKNTAKRKGPYYFAMLENSDRHDDPHDPQEQEVDEKINALLSSMVSVYIELHHIAEYSYILLEELNKTGRKYSQYRGLVNCMGYYAEKISTLLTDTDGIKDFRPLLTTLINIKQKSADITKSAVKIIEKIDFRILET